MNGFRESGDARRRRRPIVAGACRSVTGRRPPEIISAVRERGAGRAHDGDGGSAHDGLRTVLDQVAVATGGGPVVAAPASASGDAASALAALPVKGRAPKTGYDREQFGSAWADVDRNGCDTRNDMLKRDLDGETFKPGTHDCVVLTGTLNDPYTGKTIAFKRGQGTSEAVQIDHVIALSDAWQKGAQQLSPEARTNLGNDPLNLMASTGRPTRARATATPPPGCRRLRSYRCTYVARQVAVKAKYRLWVTQAEHDAIAGVLAGCPGSRCPPTHVAAPKARTPNSQRRTSAACRATACWSVSSATWSTTTRRRAASSGASCQSWREHRVE